MSIVYSLDSADIEIIKKGIRDFPISSFSMNPSIVYRDLKGINKNYFEILREIRNIIGEDKELYVQVVGETVDDMINDAVAIRKNVTGNLYIKIVASKNGFKAIKELKKQGFKISCTGVMNLNQALLAAAAGADIIAVYISRINKNGGNGIRVLKDIIKTYKELECDVTVSAASIKDPETVEKVAKIGVGCVALSYELLDLCSTHPLTIKTIEGFKNDWERLYGKNSKLSNL